MKPLHLLTIGLAVLAPSVVGCAADEEEAAGAQFPPMQSSDPAATAPVSAPGEAAIPIDVPPAEPPVAAAPAPQRMIPGETTEEEYNARLPDPEESANEDDYADQDPSALTDFRGALDPYGSWVDDPNYGTVWTPDPNVVGSDFAPYVSGGRWSYDDYQNWVWVSDYDWGWAPFHYGRWAYLGNRWGWVPGRQYAGAWVSWRTGERGYDYLGWAPIAPAYGWRGGSAFGLGFAPRTPWVFCGSPEIFSPGLGGHLVTGGQVAVVGQHTRVFATPSVAGGGGRVAAHPTVGPAPGSVGIGANEIARVPRSNLGVMHAQQFARPSTAQGLGAHASLALSEQRVASVASNNAASHNGLGPSVGYRNEPIGRAPQYVGVRPGQHYFPSHSIGTIYNIGPRYGSGYSAGGGYSSSYGGGRYGGPSYGAGYGGAYGGYRGGGVVHPGNGGSSSSSSSEGGEHEETPFHGGGSSRGGGGFRGGGGGHNGGGGHGGGGHR